MTYATSGSCGSSASAKPNCDGKPLPVEPLPVVAAVVGAVDAAMVLLPQPVGLRGMRKQLVDALADLRVLLRMEVCCDVLVDRRPALAPVVDCGTRRPRRSRCTSSRSRAESSGSTCPPAPGCQRSRVGCSRRPRFTSHVSPPSSERKSTPGSPPSQSSEPLPGSRCQRGVELQPGVLRQPDLLGALPGLPESVERWTVAP